MNMHANDEWCAVRGAGLNFAFYLPSEIQVQNLFQNENIVYELRHCALRSARVLRISDAHSYIYILVFRPFTC